MKTEKECELMAKEALQTYVNSCRPQSKEDVSKAITKMIGMAVHALSCVEHGTAEIIAKH